MHVCGMAGAQCPREATVTVRLAGIGDRSVCTEHHEWMVAMGMELRVLEPNAYRPAWTQRSLARDESGLVRA